MIFRCWRPGHGETSADQQSIEALDAESAAVHFAYSNSDGGEYPKRVAVLFPDGDTCMTFDITTEVAIVVYAHEVAEDVTYARGALK